MSTMLCPFSQPSSGRKLTLTAAPPALTGISAAQYKHFALSGAFARPHAGQAVISTAAKPTTCVSESPTTASGEIDFPLSFVMGQKISMYQIAAGFSIGRGILQSLLHNRRRCTRSSAAPPPYLRKSFAFPKSRNSTSAAMPPHSSAARLCGRFTAKLYQPETPFRTDPPPPQVPRNLSHRRIYGSRNILWHRPCVSIQSHELNSAGRPTTPGA
jgi:hypothetical protein